MRLIDADALIDEVMERYCKDCSKRKGLKNGKRRVLYSVGEAPCRACGIDDMMDEMECAPTIDAVPVVRCKNCVFFESGIRCGLRNEQTDYNDFCSKGRKKLMNEDR